MFLLGLGASVGVAVFWWDWSCGLPHLNTSISFSSCRFRRTTWPFRVMTVYDLDSSAFFMTVAGNHFCPHRTSTFAPGSYVVCSELAVFLQCTCRFIGAGWLLILSRFFLALASVVYTFLRLFTVTTPSLSAASHERMAGPWVSHI